MKTRTALLAMAALAASISAAFAARPEGRALYMMRRHLSCFAMTFILASDGETNEPPVMPMPVPAEHTTTHRWLEKKVLASRLLDDMENIKPWRLRTWNQGKGSVELTAERARDGTHSLRLRSQTAGEKPSPDGGVFGSTSAVRSVPGENWTEWNRISFWVYPSLPGFYHAALSVQLHKNKTQQARSTHHFLLENFRWNRIVWEIPDLSRDRVTEIGFTYIMNGHEPKAAATATFDIDRIELERVEPDHFEGWNVAPGCMAFSHTGYLPGARKTALAADLHAREFQLVSEATGKPILTGAIETVETGIGRFQVLDFSACRTPGAYRLRAGSRETLPFRIGDHIWRRTIWKAINFFYAERCGMAIPGVHACCHQDWRGAHGDKSIIINGGWHDAGDLSQGLVNTAEATHAMFSLASFLRQREGATPLCRRLIEEGVWGLDWILKTSFRDGHRIQWATMRFWTNGNVGDADDVTAKAQRQAGGSFYAACAEAIAARVLKDEAPVRAHHARLMAAEDWRFGVETLKPLDRENIETLAVGALASIELYRLTNEPRHAEKARELGRVITRCQHQAFLPGVRIPLTGFFYRTAERRGLQHYLHRGHEQAPIVALAALCELFPDDPAWMEWYALVALYARFYQAPMAKLTAPYHMLPNSLHRVPAGSDRRDDARAKQIRNGFDIGGSYRVRTYPVQPQNTFRGNYGTMLSQAKGVAVAARLCKNREFLELCQEQLQWIVGRNPFAQSTMYGEGYDYAPQYTARSGDMVGSLPVGMKSLGDRDLPYWPATNIWNYKEVWVHPVSRWLWLMEDVDGLTDPAGSKPSAPRLDTMERTSVTTPEGAVTIALEVTGRGEHEFTLRPFNLTIAETKRSVELRSSRSVQVEWRATVSRPDTPWIAVIVPDGDLSQRIEAIGSTWRPK